MSKENVKKMFGKLEKDAEFQKKYMALMQAQAKETDDALAGRLIEFGKSEGFSFTNGDLQAARAELADRMNASGELSDADLVKVAGGTSMPKGLAIAASIFTAGVACAGISLFVHISDGRGCPEMLSTNNCHYGTSKGK